ncbi:FKBP-type peptidyl-prolyl cis-trans isomerase [Daejeonella oryzae]|uniref:FKBP-type peptidyl-prolyl cis-trans isomerase n=1 Tax=Daejeonella oryzae TaxID=1122943 RepID=UPI000417CD7F|nr:FKBP-type peptidyl-prolyl cis-trans isomerase [Daejeonella oryzae]
MRHFLKYSLPAVFVVLFLTACEKEYEGIEQIDERKIQEYIKANNLNLTKDPSGIYYQIMDSGTGQLAKNSEKVFFNYTARSVNGTEYFPKDPYSVYSDFLGYVRPEGWRLALSLLPKGGKIRVVFPSSLGFGRNGSSPVKGNEILDSELELYNVKTQAEMDEFLIQKYMQQNSLQLTKHSSGVYYQILAPGTGTEIVDINSTITMAYTGKLLNGKIFDSAAIDKPLTSSLTNLIRGWQEVVPLITKGGKIRILIPSALGYGSAPNASIPGNSVLDFSIELTNVVN